MVQVMRKREPLAFFQPTFCAVPAFDAVILHSVNVPFLPVLAEGDDEHAEALRQKAATQTGRGICSSWAEGYRAPANAD